MRPEAAAREWVIRNLANLGAEELMVQADLDELIGHAPPDAASLSLRVFATVVDQVDHKQHDVLPLLVLPLTPTSELNIDPPDLDRFLERKWDSLELPGIYLTRTGLWTQWEDVEEYRVSVLPENPSARGLRCYYRSFRYRLARERGWEYSSCFYFRPE